MTEFKGQVNPTGTIHNPPPSVPSVNRLTAGQIGAFGTIIVDLILAQVAMALGGVDIFGIKPFAFLTQWAEDLQQQAVDAYKNSFAVVDVVANNPVGTTTSGTLNQIYSAAAAVNSTATTASENADTANGNVQTTWTALWDASKGNTGSPSANKTISDVKAAVGEVRNTGIAADGKAQDTIDGIYSAVVGGDYTGIPASYVKPQLTGLTYTARNNVATGSNLVIDPGGENAAYWTQAGVAQNSNATYVRSGSKSVSLTSAGSTARNLYFNTIDTGAVQPYIVRQSEIYLVECWVKSASAIGPVQLVVSTNGGAAQMMTFAYMTGDWVKLSIQYTVPVGVNTASFGIGFAAGATTNGSVVYVDEMLVREITNAQTAQTNVESTWNQIYNGVYNTNTTGKSLTDVRNALFTTKDTADTGVKNAATAQTTVDEGLIAGANLVLSPNFENSDIKRLPMYSLGVTQGYSTEQAHSGTQSWKWVQLQSANCGLYFTPTQTVPDFTVTADQWYYIEAWLYRAANLGSATLQLGVIWTDSVGYSTGVYDQILNPAAGTWTKYSKFVKVPAGYVKGKFYIGSVGTTTAGNVFYIDDIVVAMASKIPPKTVVSGDVSEIDGSIIQSGKVNVDFIPTGDVGAKINPGSGSGAVLTRLSTTPYKANPDRNQVGNDFYDTAEVSPSADVQIVKSGSQFTGAFKALTAGWYEVIIGYGLKRVVSNGYSMAPVLYKGSSLASLTAYKVGSEAWATPGAWTRYCQGVFVVYLNANDYVRAGYDASYGNITDPNDAIIKADATGVENYFSIALLNRTYP